MSRSHRGLSNAQRNRAALRAALAVASIAGLLAPVRSWAQVDEATAGARRELIEQAQTARERGNHVSALDLASRAGRLQMSTSLRRFIAEEQNAVGQLGASLRSAELCVHEASRETPARNTSAHLTACRALVTALQPRIGRVSVQPQGAPSGVAHVTVAGAALPEALWGVPYVVDPGQVAVDVDAPGFVHVHRVVDVRAGAVATVAIALEPAPAVPAASTSPAASESPVARTASASASPAPPVIASTVSSTSPAPASTEPIETASSAAPIAESPTPHRAGIGAGPAVVALIGVASFVVAIGLFVARNDAIGSQQYYCANESNCMDYSQASLAHDRAITLNNATIAADVIGGVALVAGVAWFIASRVARHDAVLIPSAFVVPSPHGGASAGLDVRF